MPYRRTTKKKTYRKRRGTKSNYVHKVAKYEAKRALDRELETKIFDLAFSAASVDYNTGLALNLTNGITRGTGETQYIGDSISPVGLHIRGNFYSNGSTFNTLRCIIIQNKAGGIPLNSTLLQSVNNLRAPYSPYDTNYNNTYRVLVDRTYHIAPASTPSQPINIKLSKFSKMWFNDQFGTHEKGAIYLMIVSDTTSVNLPVFQGYSRIFYKDA